MPMSPIDRLVIEFDTALRSVLGGANAQRPTPGSEISSNSGLDTQERKHAAGLMRVNHVGEVCAQALYQSQKLVARNPQIQEMLSHSGQEEMDHLAWCETRLQELGSHTSYLNHTNATQDFILNIIIFECAFLKSGESKGKWQKVK